MSAASSNQRIDGRRLWDSLMAMAEVGATSKGGVRRLALSDVDRAGRALFRGWCEAAGLAVRTDAMGNMFARRQGQDPARPPVLFGSHLDSQPTGGKFDGALGVIAGLEVMRTLNELGMVTQAPVELVNWTDEEGARFGKAMMGSGVWSGVFGQADTEATARLRRQTAWASLAGLPCGVHAVTPSPPAPSPPTAISSCTSSRARCWSAKASRSGSSPAGRRRSGTTRSSRGGTAMPAPRPPPRGGTRWWAPPASSTWWTAPCAPVANWGAARSASCSCLPNSRNVIPGEVRFSVEFRHPDEAELARIAAQFPRDAGFIARDSERSSWRSPSACAFRPSRSTRLAWPW